MPVADPKGGSASKYADRALERIWLAKGNSEQQKAALRRTAEWVACALDAIRGLAEPNPALKTLRPWVLNLAARAAKECGPDHVTIQSVSVLVHSRYGTNFAELDVSTGLWSYLSPQPWPFRELAGPRKLTRNGVEFEVRWLGFIEKMASQYSLNIDSAQRLTTLKEIQRLAAGPGAAKKTGAPRKPKALFAEWSLRTIRVLGLPTPNAGEMELLGRRCAVAGFEPSATRKSRTSKRSPLATMLRRIKRRQATVDVSEQD